MGISDAIFILCDQCAHSGRTLTKKNLDQLYVLFFSADKTTHRDMTYTVC